MTPEQEQAARERCDKATPGPWETHVRYTWWRVDSNGSCYGCDKGYELTEREQMRHKHREPDEDDWSTVWGDGGKTQISGSGAGYALEIAGSGAGYAEGIKSSEADADFIAHARTDLPLALDTIAELRAELARLSGRRKA